VVQWLGIHLAKRRMQVHPWSGTKILDAAEPLSLLTKEAYGATVKTQSSKKKKRGGGWGQDFLGGPVVKTLCSQFRGHRWGN